MLLSEFAEDLFVDFYKLVAQQKISVQGQDWMPICSFYEKIQGDQELTKNQANFLIKLLEKYKNLSAAAGYDYRNTLSSLKWKKNFRILDLSKKIYVELKGNNLEICLKFPYQLKKQFEDEIGIDQNNHKVNYWDVDSKVRRLRLYDFNLISLYEFARKHEFDIDDSFMNVLADVEEIWQNPEEILPYSTLEENCVELHNASSEIKEWWFSRKKWIVEHDLLLAKSMGYLFQGKPTNLVQKVAGSASNSFWIKTNEDFFALIKNLSGKIAIVLDRTSKTLLWLQTFIADAEKFNVSRDEIKVCFRDGKGVTTGLNDWVKSAGVGGKVEDGRILIFESKPGKWLFRPENEVIMLVTNNIYPPTNLLARDWFNCHPCVIFLGDTKPTENKGQKIVEL